MENRNSSIQREIEEKIRNDPFLKLWEENFHKNYESKVFFGKDSMSIKVFTEKYKRIEKEKIDFILVNPGPSLDKYMNQIRNKGCFILCSDVTTYRLIEENIIPDGVVTIDPSDNISRFFDFDLKLTERMVLFAPTTVNPKILELWKGPKVFFNQRDGFYQFRDNFFTELTKPVQHYGGLFNLGFVGATMIQVTMNLKPNNIYLLGWDFGSDENKNVYCRGFFDKRIFVIEKFENEEEKEKHRQNLIKKEIERLTKLELKPKDKNLPILYTNEQLLFYKDIFIKNLLPQIRSANVQIFNLADRTFLTEIPYINVEKLDLKNKNNSLSDIFYFDFSKKRVVYG